MKKRAMKKYIPKNTLYCYTYKKGKGIPCPWRRYIKTINLDKSSCEHADTCKDMCWSSFETSCRIKVYECKYLGYIDYKEDSLLWDACKECRVSKVILC